MAEDRLHHKKPDLFLRAVQEARSFSEDLLRENARLKEALRSAKSREASLKEDLSQAAESSHLKGLMRSRRHLRRQIARLEERHRKVASENEDFNRRFIEVEDLNNRLANLYIASLRLHASLQNDVVLRTAVEIVVNLVGALDFAIYLADHKTSTLRMIASEGVLGGPLSAISLEAGQIGQAARTRRVYINEEGKGSAEDPLACIPLSIEGQLVGMILIFSLLSQKEGRFSRADLEMFELLAAHAAASIAAASLYAGAEARLKTVEGYIAILRGSLAKDGGGVPRGGAS